MSQLIVTPLSADGTSDEFAYAMVSDAGVLTGHGQATPALLPAADQAVLMLPAKMLSWHAVQMPKLPRGSSDQRIQAVLAGILEEKLLDEPAHMHLVAFGSLATSKSETWVAACHKPWLLGVLRVLQAARVPLTSIVPQVFPSDLASIHVSGTPESAWVTATDADGMVCVPLSQALDLPLIQNTLNATAEPAVAAVAEQWLQRRVDVFQAPQWAVARAQAAKAQGLSLAQGDLAVSGRGHTWQVISAALRDVLAAPAWRPVRWGLLGLLCVHLIGLNAWAWKQHARVQDKRTEMTQLLSTSFPQVKVVLDAPVQMQRELALLRQAQGQLSGRDFESIYGRFLNVSGVNTAPTAIDFIANEVQLRGFNLSSSQMDALAPRLEYSGLSVRSEAQALIIAHREASAPTARPAMGAKP